MSGLLYRLIYTFEIEQTFAKGGRENGRWEGKIGGHCGGAAEGAEHGAAAGGIHPGAANYGEIKKALPPVWPEGARQ